MRTDFYDSSAFAKLFIAEAGTAAMIEMYVSADRRIVSKLAFLEVRSAIRREESAGHLAAADARLARHLLDDEERRVHVVSLNDEIVEVAQQIIDRRTVRTLDSIHLASAISLNLSNELVFVTADSRLELVAIEEGLRTKDPLKP